MEIKSRKVTDLTNEELLSEYNAIDDKIGTEYKILTALKGTKNEILFEILKRFGGEI